MPSSQKKLFLVLAVLLVMQAGGNFIRYYSEGGHGPDFYAFWQSSHNVRHDNIPALYDPGKLKVYLESYAAPAPKVAPPTLIYPPHVLLLLWPMGNLTYHRALEVWSLIPLFFYYALVALLLKHSPLMSENKSSRRLRYALVSAVLLPFLSANIFCGETGAVIAVLFLTMICCWTRYPLVAGICIGVMTVKPQLGLLIPLALMASGEWRIMGAAAGTATAMLLASVVWLGPDVWTNYLQILQLYGSVFTHGAHDFDKLAVGPYLSLRGAGLPADAAGTLQVIITLSVMAVIIRVFRNRDKGRHDMRFALLACGTLLAAPNAMCYDAPLLAAAIVPFLTRAWHRGLNTLEIVVLTAVIMMPYAQLLMMPLYVPSSMLSLLLFFGVLYRQYNTEAVPGGLVR